MGVVRWILDWAGILQNEYPQLITDLPRARESPKGPMPASGELCHPHFKGKYFLVKDFTHTAFLYRAVIIHLTRI